jgi:hypothetical protein
MKRAFMCYVLFVVYSGNAYMFLPSQFASIQKLGRFVGSNSLVCYSLKSKIEMLVDAQLKTDAQQKKTDEQLKKTDEQLKKTDEQLKKTDEQLKNLIGYNQNRDFDLEEIMRNALKHHLEETGWDPRILEVSHIYDMNGTALVEFDGFILAEEIDSGIRRLFVLEVKQVLNISKLNGFKDSLLKFRTILPTLDNRNKNASSDYLKVANRMYKCHGVDIVGVVASPSISSDTMETLKKEQMPHITSEDKVYAVRFL